MIDPKINIRSKPTHSAQQESLVKGNAAIARADAAVQTRAYELYELRGRTDGRAGRGLVPSRSRPERSSKHVGDPKCQAA